MFRLRPLFAVSFFACSATLSAGENVWRTHGPHVQVTALAADPNGIALFAAGRDAEARSMGYRSVDHGATWMSVGELASPFLVSAILAGSDSVLASAATPDGAFPAAEILMSSDEGLSWSSVAEIDGFLVRSFQSPAADAAVIYAAGTARRCVAFPCFGHTESASAVLQSRDAGRTWTAFNAGLLGFQLFALALDPAQSLRLLTGGDAGVFASDDGGEHWSPASSGLDSCPTVTALAIAEQTSYAAAAQSGGEVLGCGELFRSSDEGRNWTSTSLRHVFPTSITVDPTDPQTIYVGVSKPGPLYPDGGVFRTTDGGSTWEKLGSGLPASGVLGIVVEPSGTFLHAATLEGVFDYEIVQGARPPIVPRRFRGTRRLPARP